ncbi:MAG TPA: hypothetical protein VFV12_14310, partial [Xanthobacteraceae bacterium]|nr:hypothetical protein [Xanthobacteraceae bacterium]
MRALANDRDPALAASSMRSLYLYELAKAVDLPAEFLRRLGLDNFRVNRWRAVRIPYLDAGGKLTAVRYQVSLDGESRLKWRGGDKPALYGMDRLEEFRREGWVLLVENEADCWRLWYEQLPALALSDATAWRAEWAEALANLDVFLWHPDDDADRLVRLGAAIPSLRVIVPADDLTDFAEARRLHYDICGWLEELRAHAWSYESLKREQAQRDLLELEQQARPVLEAPDPLAVVQAEIRRRGYGGDINPALIVYLAATSRLLAVREGAMPVHLLLLGAPSGGKSYTVSAV